MTIWLKQHSDIDLACSSVNRRLFHALLCCSKCIENDHAPIATWRCAITFAITHYDSRQPSNFVAFCANQQILGIFVNVIFLTIVYFIHLRFYIQYGAQKLKVVSTQLMFNHCKKIIHLHFTRTCTVSESRTRRKWIKPSWTTFTVIRCRLFCTLIAVSSFVQKKQLQCRSHEKFNQ